MDPELEEETPPPAPPPAPASQRTIVLLDYAEVHGELRPKGKVLETDADEAQRLVGANLARDAGEGDLRIAGLL